MTNASRTSRSSVPSIRCSNAGRPSGYRMRKCSDRQVSHIPKASLDVTTPSTADRPSKGPVVSCGRWLAPSAGIPAHVAIVAARTSRLSVLGPPGQCAQPLQPPEAPSADGRHQLHDQLEQDQQDGLAHDPAPDLPPQFRQPSHDAGSVPSSCRCRSFRSISLNVVLSLLEVGLLAAPSRPRFAGFPFAVRFGLRCGVTPPLCAFVRLVPRAFAVSSSLAVRVPTSRTSGRGHGP